MKRPKTHCIHVYDWNPNGTNDITIVSTQGDRLQEIDALDEALFGIDINKIGVLFQEHSEASRCVRIPLKTALRHIAISPVEDGSRTINFLKQYFKSLK